MILDEVEADYEWYTTDKEGYLAEEIRFDTERQTQYDSQLKSFMGEEYNTPPKRTRKQLKTSIENWRKSMERAISLGAQENVINHYEETIRELLLAEHNKDYIRTESDKIYKKLYLKKMENFKFEFKFEFNIPDFIKEKYPKYR
jgi:hypothetical protein